jgi:hypothetical protein
MFEGRLLPTGMTLDSGDGVQDIQHTLFRIPQTSTASRSTRSRIRALSPRGDHVYPTTEQRFEVHLQPAEVQ